MPKSFRAGKGIGAVIGRGSAKCDHIRDCSRGLTIENNPINPLNQVDVAAKEIILQDANHNSLRVTDVDLTLDVTTAGANGLDSGSEASYQWYYIWIIAMGNGTVAGLLSSSPEDPTVPSGYIYRAFVGAIHNCRNNGNDFGPIRQVGNTVARNAVAVVNGGVATGPTAIDCSGALPQKAVKVAGDITLNIAVGGGRGAAWIRSAPDQGCVEFAGYLDTQGRLTVPFCIPVIEDQTLYFNVDAGSRAESATISVSGFEY